MREKLKYTPMAITCIIIDACLLLGAFFSYLPMGSLKNSSYMYSYGMGTGMNIGTYQMFIFLLLIASGASLAAVIFKVVYFIQRERKPSIIISAGVVLVSLIMMMAFFGMLLSTVFGGLSSTSYYSSMSGVSRAFSMMPLMIFGIFLAVAALVFDIMILLGMKGIIKSEGFLKLIPSLKKDEQGISKNPFMMQLVLSLIFGLLTVLVIIKVLINPLGIISGIFTWAMLLMAGFIGIGITSVMMFIYWNKNKESKIVLIDAVVNGVIGVLAVIGILSNMAGGFNIGNWLYKVLMIIAILSVLLQIVFILGCKGIIAIKGLEAHIEATCGNKSSEENDGTEKTEATEAVYENKASEEEISKEITSETSEAMEQKVGDMKETAGEDENTEDVTKVLEEKEETVQEISDIGVKTTAAAVENENIAVKTKESSLDETSEKPSFVNTKKGKITLCAIIAAVVLAVGVCVWYAFFHKTQIDAFDGVKVEFRGDDGSGYASITEKNIDYDMNDYEMSMFVNSMYFDIENNGNLKNGDKVKVTVKYSEATADRLKVKIKEDSKEFEVTGLTKKYQSADEIDAEVYDKAYKAAEKKAKEDDGINGNKNTFYKAYFIKEDRELSYQRNKLVFVYKQEYKTYDAEKNGEVTKTRYVGYYTDFDSDFKEGDYMFSTGLYVPDKIEQVAKEEDILPSIEDRFGGKYRGYGVTVEEVKISI